MKRYKVIYRAFELGDFSPGRDTMIPGGGEAFDWSRALNNHAELGWIVISSGVIEDSSRAERMVFWALLEEEADKLNSGLDSLLGDSKNQRIYSHTIDIPQVEN